MDPIAVAILIGIAVPFGYFLILALGTIIFDKKHIEEGTLEERNLNPELNTANLDLHKMRLSKFQKSKYYSTMYYMGKKGGIYTVSYNGNKVYKQISMKRLLHG